ncbi:MAG: sugar phosphate isomerase/epimerase [Verrucomicrobia bacterium]|nr:sugar phosphate isomerase/epimerase [Verrucomicrobiota bacterium]
MLKFATKLAPQPERLSNAHEVGFEYAEIFLTSKSIKKPKALAGLLGNYPLSYGLHFINRGPLSKKQLKKTIRLYRLLDCESMVIHQPMYRLYSEALLDIDPGLCLAVENHRLKLKSFWRWADSHEHLTLDVEHLWKHTLKQAPLSEMLPVLKKFLKRHGSQLKRVHLPGYQPGSLEHQPLSFNPKLARKVLKALSKIDYQGLIVSETRPSMQKPKFLRNDINLFQNWEKTLLQKSKSNID